MNTNIKVIGLTRLGIKPESTAQETNAPYHSAIYEAVMTNVKVIGLTRLGIKPESTAQETDAPYQTDAPYHSARRSIHFVM